MLLILKELKREGESELLHLLKLLLHLAQVMIGFCGLHVLNFCDLL